MELELTIQNSMVPRAQQIVGQQMAEINGDITFNNFL